MTGSVWRRNGVTAAFVSGSSRTAGRRDSSDERSTGANLRTSASARSEARSEPGSRATDSEIWVSSFASAPNTLCEAVTSLRRSSGWLPTSVIRRP